MSQFFAKKLYDSKRWRNLRKEVIIENLGLCQRCKEYGNIVHHKIHLTPANIDNFEVALNKHNLELLCLVCHNKEHMTNKKLSQASHHPSIMFDENGNVVKNQNYKEEDHEF